MVNIHVRIDLLNVEVLEHEVRQILFKDCSMHVLSLVALLRLSTSDDMTEAPVIAFIMLSLSSNGTAVQVIP